MKKAFTIRLDEETISDFEAVAEDNHMTANGFAAVAIGKLAKLKPEFALAALGSIPQEYFKRGRGRPPAAASRSDRNGEAP